MNMSQQTTETGASMLSKAAASAPPVTAGVASFAGLPLPGPVEILTCLWFVVLISHKIWKWRIECQQLKQGKPAQDDDDE